MATAAPKETPAPPTTQNLFTIVVEHSSDVESISDQVQKLITALPSVTRVAILRPDSERCIVSHDGHEYRRLLR